MKKNLSLLSILLMTTSLVSCGVISSESNTPSDSKVPSEQVSTPAGSSTVESTQPSSTTVESTTPAPSTPSVQPSTPSVEPSTPSVQPSAPSVEPSSPSVQPSAPSVEPSSPSVEPSAPSVEPSSPSVEPSAPSVEPSTPVEPSRPDYGTLSFDTSKQITLEIYTSLSSTAQYGLLFDQYLDMFEELYPNITVNHTRPGGYDDIRDQLKTELATGQGPNIAYCYPDHVALYNKARAVQTLDKFIYNNQTDADGNYLYGLSDEQIDAFFDGYWEEGKSYGDGKMYTLPLYKSTEVLYYNIDVLEEEGLEVPTHWFKDDAGMDPNTSLEHALEVLKAKYPTSTPLGYDSESNWFITMCEQYGSPYTSATGEHFLFDNEVNRNFVKKFKSWYDRGLVTTQEIYGGYTSAIFTNTTDSSITRSYFSIGSSAGATKQVPADGSFEVGITQIPQVNPDNPKAISQGPSLVMFKKADQDEVMATWLLMRFLTSNINFQAEMSMSSGYVPAVESVFENDIYLEWLDSASGDADGVAAYCVNESLKNSESFFTSPAFVGSSDARDQVGDLIQAVFLANSTTDSIDKIVADAFELAIRNCKEG